MAEREMVTSILKPGNVMLAEWERERVVSVCVITSNKEESAAYHTCVAVRGESEWRCCVCPFVWMSVRVCVMSSSSLSSSSLPSALVYILTAPVPHHCTIHFLNLSLVFIPLCCPPESLMTGLTLLLILWEGNFRSALLCLVILLCEGVAWNIFRE